MTTLFQDIRIDEYTHGKGRNPLKRFLYVLMWLSIVFIAMSFLEFYLLDRRIVLQLAEEDGFFETFGSLCLLLGGVILLIVWKNSPRGNDMSRQATESRNVLLLLALLFLFGGLEEISWGQRIFGYPTPKFFMEHNEQHEVNIHNLSVFHGRDEANLPKRGASAWINMDFLFSLFWLTFFLIIPLLERYSEAGAKIIRTLGIPVVARWIGWVALAIYLVSRFMEPMLSHALQNALVEIKECDLELLIFVAAVDLLVRGSNSHLPGPRYAA